LKPSGIDANEEKEVDDHSGCKRYVYKDYFFEFCWNTKSSSIEEDKRQRLEWEITLSEFLSRNIMKIWNFEMENKVEQELNTYSTSSIDADLFADYDAEVVKRSDMEMDINYCMNMYKDMNVLYQLYIQICEPENFNLETTLTCVDYVLLQDVFEIASGISSLLHHVVKVSVLWKENQKDKDKKSRCKSLRMYRDTVMKCWNQLLRQVISAIESSSYSNLTDPPYHCCQLLIQLIRMLRQVETIGLSPYETSSQPISGSKAMLFEKKLQWESIFQTVEDIVNRLNTSHRFRDYNELWKVIEKQLIWLEGVIKTTLKTTKVLKSNGPWLFLYANKRLLDITKIDVDTFKEVETMCLVYQLEIDAKREELFSLNVMYRNCYESIQILAKRCCIVSLSTSLVWWIETLMEMFASIPKNSESNFSKTRLSIVLKIIGWVDVGTTYVVLEKASKALGRSGCDVNNTRLLIALHELRWINDRSNTAIAVLDTIKGELRNNTKGDVVNWLLEWDNPNDQGSLTQAAASLLAKNNQFENAVMEMTWLQVELQKSEELQKIKSSNISKHPIVRLLLPEV
jgi:hypothetical protein